MRFLWQSYQVITPDILGTHRQLTPVVYLQISVSKSVRVFCLPQASDFREFLWGVYIIGSMREVDDVIGQRVGLLTEPTVCASGQLEHLMCGQPVFFQIFCLLSGNNQGIIDQTI